MKKILYLLTLLMTISFGSYGQQLKQIQKGTDKNQIPVTNGKQNTQVYRDAIPYILDTLGIRDSLSGSTGTTKGKGLPTRVAWWASTDSLSYDSLFYWDSVNKRLGINRDIDGIQTTLHVGGDFKVDVLPPSPVKIAGWTSDTIINAITIGTGLDLTSGVLSATALPTPDSTKVVGQWAIQVNESPKQQFNLKVDSSKVATKYDLTQISGGVTNVTATAPITSSGGATPNISISQSGASANGYLSSTDWNTFNNKVGGSGTATRVAFWNSGSTLSSNSNLYWDNTNSRLGVGLISNLDAWLNIQGMAGMGSEKAIAFRNSGGWVSSWIKTFNNASPQQRGISFGGRRYDGAENNDILVINGFSAYPSVGINTPYPLADLHVTTPFSSGSDNGIRLDHSSSIQSVRQINDEGDIILRSTTGHMSVGKLSTWTNNLNPSVTLHLFGDGGNTSDGLFRLEKPGGWGYTQLNQYAQASPFARGIKIYHDTGGTPVIVTNSNGNRVGINKEAPDAQLHVGGTMIVDNPTGTATKLTGLTSANQLTTLTIGTGLDLTSGVLRNTVTVPLTWAAVYSDVCSWGSTEAFNSGKKIGISTCSPSRQLDVLGDVRFRGAIYSSTNSAGTAGQVLTSNGTGAWYWSTPSAVNLAFDTKSGTDVYMYPSGGGSGVIFRDGDGTTVNRVASNVIKIDATGGTTYNGVRNSGSYYYVQNYDTGGTKQGNGVKMEGGKGTVVTGAPSTNGGLIKVEAEAAKFGQLYRTSSDYTNSSISGSEFKVDFDASMINLLTVNTSTDRITIPSTETGEYRITYSLTYKINTSGAYVGGLDFYVKKNGTSIGYRSTNKSRNYINDSDNMVTISRDFIYYLAGSDYIELFAIRNAGTFTSATLMNAVFNVQKITNTVYP